MILETDVFFDEYDLNDLFEINENSQNSAAVVVVEAVYLEEHNESSIVEALDENQEMVNVIAAGAIATESLEATQTSFKMEDVAASLMDVAHEYDSEDSDVVEVVAYYEEDIGVGDDKLSA